jgi:hypothetical protein
MEPRELRRLFFTELYSGLWVVWPILSALLGAMVLLGAGVALIEGWPLGDGIYFAFVSGLTIGYGDLVPHRPIARVLAIGIGLLGLLLIALVAAVAVRAMEHMTRDHPDR